MRIWNGWLAVLLTAGVALAPTAVRGQEEEAPPPDSALFLPVNNRPERGGFYAGVEFLMFRQDNPLKNQIIAVRGFQDTDGSVTADVNGTVVATPGGGTVIIPGAAAPGTFYGSGATALAASDAGGPLSYEPGTRITLGWKFKDGISLEASYLTLAEAKYSAVATLVPPGGNAGPLLADSFLFSPVYNFPNDFAGAAQKIALGNPFAVYGIWNGASVESISFVQRYDQYDIDARVPIFQTEYCRCYGMVGFRHVSMWENFKWRVVSEDTAGQSGPDSVALYSNIVSNQLYGPNIGVGMDWDLSHGFGLALQGQASALGDFVHEIARYERSDFVIGNKRAQRQFTITPELNGSLNVYWYPIHSVEIRVGYELMEFINTMASPQPVSFNYGGLDPTYSSTARFFNGFNAGVAFLF